jgi:hypothetical protein
LYKFTKEGVKWKLTATATILKTDPAKHTGIQRNMWDVGERTLPFKQNYLPQVYLSLMN